MEQAELIAKCKEGDQKALGQLYTQFRPLLLGICRQYTDEDSVAEDLLHDAFVVILTSLDRLRTTDKPGPWMTAITRHVCYHYAEHAQTEKTMLRQIAIDTHGQTEEARQPDFSQLQTLVAQLPEGYQRVFRLSVFEGLSHQEIGQLLGIAPHSSSSQLSHAKRMLRILIRQSWALLLLLLIIPVWMLRNRNGQTESVPVEPTVPPSAATIAEAGRQDSAREHHPEKAVTAVTAIRPTMPVAQEAVLAETTGHADEPLSTEQPQPSGDTIRLATLPTPPRRTTVADHATYTPKPRKEAAAWDVTLAYNGQLGQRDDFYGQTQIHSSSFNAYSNSYIEDNHPISNWTAYSAYLHLTNLNTEPSAETRSLMSIASRNTQINHGDVEARYQHQLPISLLLTVSRQLTSKLSVETGLSYTLLKSTITTGSPGAYIEERQRLRYVGLPLRLGYQWYHHGDLRLYGSAGVMFELPVHSTLDVRHVTQAEGVTFTSDGQHLSAPVQWSGLLGVGIQYDLTPRLGVYLEPSLQYFPNNGSKLKSYRTEHPLGITLPLGIRFHW